MASARGCESAFEGFSVIGAAYRSMLTEYSVRSTQYGQSTTDNVISLSLLPPYVQRRDSKCQRPILYVLQPDAAHPLGERFAVGELGDGRGKVFVRPGFVAGEELADAGQDVAEVKQVDRTQRLPAGCAELQYGDLS